MRVSNLFIAILLTLSLSESVARGDDSDKPIGPKVGSVLEVDISKLHPTQFRVGKKEVKEKQTDFEKMGPDKLEAYLKAHPCPVVIGPEGTFYITDEQHRANAGAEAEHHQTLHALEKNGHPTMYTKIVASYPDYLRKCEKKHENPQAFDDWMVGNNYTFLDDRGKARPFKDLPKHVYDMGNDAYRSLAGFLEKKAFDLDDGVNFAQFKVADWLRKRIGLSDAQVDGLSDDKKFLKQVKHLLNSKAAKKEPWYKGPEYSKDKVSCLVDKIQGMAK